MNTTNGRPVFMRRRTTALAATLCAGLTAAAPGQFGEAAGFGEMMSPYFLRRDLQVFVDGLDLDEGQAVVIESLFWDYEDEHEAGKVRMLDRLSQMREDIQDMPRDGVLQLVFKPFEDRSAEWDRMREQFLINVEAILSQGQGEQWPAFRRELRRRKELPKGRFSGESLNLFEVVRQMDLDPRMRTTIEPALVEYDFALDIALKRREQLLRDSRLAIMHSIRDEDPGSALQIYEQQIAARIAIRAVNDDYTEVVAAALPEDLAQRLRELALESAYPRVYRLTAAQRLFEQALQKDYPTETMEAVITLSLAFDREIAVINERIRVLLQRYEPEETRFRAQSFATRAGGDRPEKPKDPTREEFKSREKLGRRYIQMLRDILTPEQFAELDGAQRFLRRDEREAAESAVERKRRIMERRPDASIGNRVDE